MRYNIIHKILSFSIISYYFNCNSSNLDEQQLHFKSYKIAVTEQNSYFPNAALAINALSATFAKRYKRYICCLCYVNEQTIYLYVRCRIVFVQVQACNLGVLKKPTTRQFGLVGSKKVQSQKSVKKFGMFWTWMLGGPPSFISFLFL